MSATAPPTTETVSPPSVALSPTPSVFATIPYTSETVGAIPTNCTINYKAQSPLSPYVVPPAKKTESYNAFVDIPKYEKYCSSVDEKYGLSNE